MTIPAEAYRSGLRRTPEYASGEYRRYPFDETAFPEPMTALAYVARRDRPHQAAHRRPDPAGAQPRALRQGTRHPRRRSRAAASSWASASAGCARSSRRSASPGRTADAAATSTSRRCARSGTTTWPATTASSSRSRRDPLRPEARAARRRAADRWRPHEGGGRPRRALRRRLPAARLPQLASDGFALMHATPPGSRPAGRSLIPTRPEAHRGCSGAAVARTTAVGQSRGWQASTTIGIADLPADDRGGDPKVLQQIAEVHHRDSGRRAGPSRPAPGRIGLYLPARPSSSSRRLVRAASARSPVPTAGNRSTMIDPAVSGE